MPILNHKFYISDNRGINCLGIEAIKNMDIKKIQISTSGKVDVAILESEEIEGQTIEEIYKDDKSAVFYNNPTGKGELIKFIFLSEGRPFNLIDKQDGLILVKKQKLIIMAKPYDFNTIINININYNSL